MIDELEPVVREVEQDFRIDVAKEAYKATPTLGVLEV